MLKKNADNSVALKFVFEKPAKVKSIANKPGRFESGDPDKSSAEATFEQHAEDPSDELQALVQVARGVQMILSNLPEGKIKYSMAWSLGDALSAVIEPVDAYYFESVGELNSSIHPEHLEILLERSLAKVRAKIEEKEKNTP